MFFSRWEMVKYRLKKVAFAIVGGFMLSIPVIIVMLFI